MPLSVRSITLLCGLCASVVLTRVYDASLASAQSLRYMDSSGNLRFADSIKDVPKEYRQQIYPPTPTPVLTRQQQVQKRLDEERIQRQKMQQERMKQMERDRRAMQAEKANRKRQNELKQDEVSSGFQPGAF